MYHAMSGYDISYWDLGYMANDITYFDPDADTQTYHPHDWALQV